MSDMGDVWREIKAEQQQARVERLKRADPAGWYQHTPHHWSRLIDGLKLDYWPSTGKWYYRLMSHKGTTKMWELIAGAKTDEPYKPRGKAGGGSVSPHSTNGGTTKVLPASDGGDQDVPW